MGHIGYMDAKSAYIMHFSLMTKTAQFQSPMYSLHERLARGRLEVSQYQECLLSGLRGKKGVIRHMNCRTSGMVC